MAAKAGEEWKRKRVSRLKRKVEVRRRRFLLFIMKEGKRVKEEEEDFSD